MLHETAASSREKSDYWEEFYSNRPQRRLAAPSQFAAFVAQEAGDAHLIIEIGCGTGRDSLFFARQGYAVVGLDGSHVAIQGCEETRDSHGITGATFVCAAVGSAGFLQAVKSARRAGSGEALVYARFFLHAITEDEEKAFFEDLSVALRAGDRVALEYRTVRDASGTKVTPAHYRRFVEPSRVFANALRLGFSVEYAVEGFGFAKYKEDDAYVARCILRKS